MEYLKQLQFTPETPFGLPLYPYFEKAFEAVTGTAASKFDYVPQVTPLSTVNEGKFYKEKAAMKATWSKPLIISSFSHHDLCYLFHRHLWWSLPHEERACLQAPSSFHDSQLFVDGCFFHPLGLDGRADLPHLLSQWLDGCYLC